MDDEDDLDDDFPFAGHSREWIELFALTMRELSTEAPDPKMRTECRAAADEADAYLQALDNAPPR